MKFSWKQFPGLTGNQLKVLAMVTMTLDHIGAYLLPQVWLLRIVGRLALPIYAYMIAEGCRYTRSPGRYLLRIAGLAAVCQAVYFVAMGSVFQCILVTFSISIVLILALQRMQRAYTAANRLLLLLALAGAGFVCEGLPLLLRGTDFGVDYGFCGVVLPVLIYLGRNRWEKLAALALGLVLLGLDYGSAQWFALAAVPLLLAYNGQRGKVRMGMVFYLYYPVHLVVIYAIGWLLAG